MKKFKSLSLFLIAIFSVALMSQAAQRDVLLAAQNDEQKDVEEITLEKVIEEAARDGNTVARSLNDIENEDVFEDHLKEVLDIYYSEENTPKYKKQLEQFIDTIDERASEEIQNYEDAAKERASQDELDYLVGEIIVDFDENVTVEEAMQIAEEMDATLEWKDTPIVTEDFKELPEHKQRRLQKIWDKKLPSFAVMHIALGQTVDKAIDYAEKHEEVIFAEPNMICEELVALTNDLRSEDQYTYFNNINIKQAWNEVPGYSVAWVAVIDTGMQTTHQDLQNMYLKNRTVDITKAGYPLLDSLSASNRYVGDHGTLVAGIIAAQGNNNMGIAGVATGLDNGICKIMGIKAAKTPPVGENITFATSDVIAGINYAVANGADIINMSLGGKGSYKNEMYKQALKYAYDNNVIVVAAAGNDNSAELHYPAACTYVENGITIDPVIGVMALYSSSKASYSNYGAWTDIGAPGGEWTKSTQILSTTLNNKYDKCCGTSMAAPIVSGVIAILRGVDSLVTPKEVKSILQATSTRLTGSNTFYGRVNAGLALQEMMYREVNKMILTCTAKTLTNQNVKISWRESGYNNYYVDRYAIYRATSKNGTYEKIGTAEDFSSSYTDKNTKKGKTYFYKVRPQTTYGDGYKSGKFSNIVSAKVA